MSPLGSLLIGLATWILIRLVGFVIAQEISDLKSRLGFLYSHSRFILLKTPLEYYLSFIVLMAYYISIPLWVALLAGTLTGAFTKPLNPAKSYRQRFIGLFLLLPAISIGSVLILGRLIVEIPLGFIPNLKEVEIPQVLASLKFMQYSLIPFFSTYWFLRLRSLLIDLKKEYRP